ncbi:AAA domain-containing protein [Nonomuraea polychroma]|uniref:AAA domain-containing protein n=1 Tax=Nonomuraea polychroma TaxID=46176 RepID=A0A438MA19_9ACTN|nr:ATP-binding protein [Nonomuraea polychroma]RVX42564.1 AAA domain-containing protein [Nonomuraea polychroma]
MTKPRYFNTTGPCHPRVHYVLPSQPRLPQARQLIGMDRFFVIHAPRQSGKTTLLHSLQHELTKEGAAVAATISCEAASVAGDDYEAAELILLNELRRSTASAPDPWPEAPPGGRLGAALEAWAAQCELPLVLLIDEIDALSGESLKAVLRQLRTGHNNRHNGVPFPNSVVLCGLRDVREYKIASGGDLARLGAISPFNISVKSLRLGDFTREDTEELYGQHTAETGQEFTKEALAAAWDFTRGQPWLVNALGWEITFEMRVPPEEPITVEHMEQAKERLIRARATHLDSLVAKLYEPRVKRVIEPVLAGTSVNFDAIFTDDFSYVRDLGLVAMGSSVEIANPIYREVILRVLGFGVEVNVVLDDSRSFVLPDGRLDLLKLLREFTAFWKQHGEMMVRGTTYHEAACQIILMAYLHRIVNGGGFLDREYAAGTGRLDVYLRWPYGERQVQREAMELKVWRPGQRDPVDEGLAQLDRYLDRLDLDTGYLVVFDRRPEAAPMEERVRFDQDRTPAGRQVTVLRA